MPKIKKMKIRFISLVDQGANGKRVIYKSDDGSDFKFELDLKYLRKDDKKGIIYGTVYEPDEVDSQEDWADSDTIEEAAHDFLKEGRVKMVDLHHSNEAGAGTIVESFVKHGPDPRFPDSKDGSWCVAIQLDDKTKEHLSEIGGLSMAGGGLFDMNAPPPTKTPKSVTKQATFRTHGSTVARRRSLARIRPNK